METAAHPRFLLKPRTFGMIVVTLTSSASLRTGVVKTFRCTTYRVTAVEPKHIRTRDEMIAFVADVVRDHDSDGSQWENGDIRSFLEAMASWLEDCDGYYQNNGDDRDVNIPAWQIFADALAAARIYE